MATVNKDFKIKNGLVVEGTTATVNGFDILTKKTDDQNYIINLIGGTATSNNTPNTVVKRDGSGSFAANTITANLIGNVTGDVTGFVTGTVSSLSNHDTADLAEGTNLYFTNQRALDATAAAYDAAGTAATEAGLVADDLTDHANATVAHGATGAVVGTTNTQTLTNKTIGDTLNFTGAGAMTINSDSHIVLTPAAGSSVKWGADVLATQGYAADTAANALANAEAYADGLASNYDAAGSAANALADANEYTDNAVASLVDSAPELLDTLNELAQALQDNPNVIADLQDVAAGKQDTLTAGDNIDITGATISVTGLDTDDVAEGTNLYFSNARAVSANTGLWDTIGAAANALADAEDYADGLAVNYDASGSAANALADANSYTDNAISNIDLVFNTDEISEGATNQYFTDSRAKDSAADLLTGASLTNITITGSGAGLTITAENGVADSDTDDLDEGSTNLYFSNARAVAALEAVVPNFTAVEINSLAKEVAATATISSPSTATALTWDTEEYRTVKAIVKFATANHTEVSEVLLTLDGLDNIAITEYAIVGTNGSMGTITATVVAGEGRLNVTTLNNATVVFVRATLLV
jgi:hypothetical protein